MTPAAIASPGWECTEGMLTKYFLVLGIPTTVVAVPAELAPVFDRPPVMRAGDQLGSRIWGAAESCSNPRKKHELVFPFSLQCGAQIPYLPP